MSFELLPLHIIWIISFALLFFGIYKKSILITALSSMALVVCGIFGISNGVPYISGSESIITGSVTTTTNAITHQHDFVTNAFSIISVFLGIGKLYKYLRGQRTYNFPGSLTGAGTLPRWCTTLKTLFDFTGATQNSGVFSFLNQNVESSDLKVSKLEKPRFLPEEVNFNYPVDSDLMDLILGTTEVVVNGSVEKIPNVYFKFEWTNENDELEHGYLLNLKPKVSGEFKFQKANDNLIF